MKLKRAPEGRPFCALGQTHDAGPMFHFHYLLGLLITDSLLRVEPVDSEVDVSFRVIWIRELPWTQ